MMLKVMDKKFLQTDIGLLEWDAYDKTGERQLNWKNLTQGCRVGLVSPIGFKVNFKADPIFQSASWFFFIIPKSIFTSIFEIKIYEKKFLPPKKISFSKADF